MNHPAASRKPIVAWYEDDRLWLRFLPFLFRKRVLAETSAQVDRLIGLLELSNGTQLLDLCCGIGRLSLEFARRGYLVTGVDRTLPYLELARRAAASEGLKVEFVSAGMDKFARPAAFSAAVCMYNSFGYFEDPADDRRVIANLYESLQPGGKLALDVLGREVLARIYRPCTREKAGTAVLLQRREITRNWTWLVNHSTITDAEGRHEFSFGHRLYSGSELHQLLLAAGFVDVALYGDLAGRPYDQNAQMLLAVGRKPLTTRKMARQH
jgi:SAM-dependent methyltransferase